MIWPLTLKNVNIMKDMKNSGRQLNEMCDPRFSFAIKEDNWKILNKFYRLSNSIVLMLIS